MRVFMGLCEISGYYRNLKYGFSQIGVPCTFINIVPHKFEYGGADDNWMVLSLQRLRYNTDYDNLLLKVSRGTARVLKKIDAALSSAPYPIRKIYSKTLKNIVRPYAVKEKNYLELFFLFLLFAWALISFDVFIFGYNTHFFGATYSNHKLTQEYWDLRILRFFKKKVIYVYHGSDSRPPYLDGAMLLQNDYINDLETMALLSKQLKKKVTQIEELASYTVDLITQGHFHEKPFILWQNLGVPSISPTFDTSQYEMENRPFKDNDSPIRILHCPSLPAAKGTEVIRATIQEMVEAGIKLELVELINQPNYRVHEELQKCDFVVDQILSPCGLGGFGVEAAFWGKPVIVAGYEKIDWASILPESQIPPLHYTHPDRLKEAIYLLATDPVYREALGQKAKKFVQTEWHSITVAKRFVQLYTEQFPQSWYHDPFNIDYIHGFGMREEKLAGFLKQYTDTQGKEALCLGDKPALEQRVLSLINTHAEVVSL